MASAPLYQYQVLCGQYCGNDSPTAMVCEHPSGTSAWLVVINPNVSITAHIGDPPPQPELVWFAESA